MRKAAILGCLMAVALYFGVTGTSLNAVKVQATPTDMISFNPDVCWSLTGGDDACFTLNEPASLAQVAADLGGSIDDPDTYVDLVQASGTQLGSQSTSPGGTPTWDTQSMWVFTFVPNDTNLHLEADEGVWLSSGTDTTACPFNDEDCDGDGVSGDGVVVDLLYAGSEAPLDLGLSQITAWQDDEELTVAMDYRVVGQPHELDLYPSKKIIQQDSGAACALSDFNNEVALPDVTGLDADIYDDNYEPLAGIWVDWGSSDAGSVALATTRSVSLVHYPNAYASNLGCGNLPGISAIEACTPYICTLVRIMTVELLGQIEGIVFDDANANGTRDAGEEGLAGIHLFTCPDMTCDSSTDFTDSGQTAADGSFAVPPAEVLCLNVPTDWTGTAVIGDGSPLPGFPSVEGDNMFSRAGCVQVSAFAESPVIDIGLVNTPAGASASYECDVGSRAIVGQRYHCDVRVANDGSTPLDFHGMILKTSHCSAAGACQPDNFLLNLVPHLGKGGPGDTWFWNHLGWPADPVISAGSSSYLSSFDMEWSDDSNGSYEEICSAFMASPVFESLDGPTWVFANQAGMNLSYICKRVEVREQTPTPTATSTATPSPTATPLEPSTPTVTVTATATPYGGAAPGLRGPPSVGTGRRAGFSSGWLTWVLAVLLGTGLSLLTVTALVRYRPFKTWRD